MSAKNGLLREGDFAERFHELALCIDRLLAFRMLALIFSLIVHRPSKLVISEVGAQSFGNHTLFEPRIEDGESQFDPPEKIAIHPVRARKVDKFISAVVEIIDAVMFQKAPNN